MQKEPNGEDRVQARLPEHILCRFLAVNNVNALQNYKNNPIEKCNPLKQKVNKTIKPSCVPI